MFSRFAYLVLGVVLHLAWIVYAYPDQKIISYPVIEYLTVAAIIFVTVLVYDIGYYLRDRALKKEIRTNVTCIREILQERG